MIFNTPLFYFFFVTFFFFYAFVFLRQTPRVYLILVSSLVFYGAWNYRFIPLLVGSAVIDYFIAQAVHAAPTQGAKKRWLSLSVVMNLGLLGLFKYADFVLESVADFLGLFGLQADLPTLGLVLPVGISFYTFQSLSYTIDVYRGELEPRRGLAEFTAALSFFPQLVAGPILRAREILPHMHAIAAPTWSEAKHGLLLISAGVLKKTTADLLAVPAQKVFDSGASLSLLETWTGVLAFAGQIYGDFAGYTDMAIGLALLLGFKIPLNFRVPYFAVSPVDFWRRWHISLSSWLRDYLYISLGGNRTGHRARNVMITMLLGGLWHGAAWTFVAWGAFHGLIISAAHAAGRLPLVAALGDVEGPRRAWIRLGQGLATFYLVLLGWVLFRAQSLGSAWQVMLDMHGLGGPLPSPSELAGTIFLLTFATCLLMHLLDLLILKKGDVWQRKPWLFWPFLLLVQTFCYFVGEPSREFIYFQF